MTTLTCLADLYLEHPDEVPTREEPAWVDGVDPVILHYTGEFKRTAIVRWLPEGTRQKDVINLHRLFVDARTLRWVRKDDEVWASVDGRHIRGGPTMRQRREKGRINAQLNKPARGIVCSVCQKQRDGAELAKYPGTVCGPCRNAREYRRRLEQRAMAREAI